jgi:hypothetical protein
LANEYIKTAQKSITEITGRVRNQLFDPADSVKEGLQSKNMMENLLCCKAALEQGKLTQLAIA